MVMKTKNEYYEPTKFNMSIDKLVFMEKNKIKHV